jgi:hypothetical protein
MSLFRKTFMLPRLGEISKRGKWIQGVAMCLAMASFVTSLIVQNTLGGDALQAYFWNHPHCVCSKWGCHEVSQSIWAFSFWLEVSTFGIYLALFIVTGILMYTREIVITIRDPK